MTSSSCKVRVILSSKGGKKRITDVKKVAMLTKQIKQEIKIKMAVILSS